MKLLNCNFCIKKSVYILLLFTLKSEAQIQRNQYVVGLGVASTISGIVINNLDQNSSASPCFNAFFDLGQTTRFSLGLAYAYDEVNRNERYYFQYNNTQVYAGDYRVAFRRNNLGARFLFHFSKKQAHDFYIGIRPGYSFVSKTIENLPPNAIAYGQNINNISIFKMRNRYTVQGLIGYRFFWNESFGIMTEACIGPPFFFNLGLCMKM